VAPLIFFKFIDFLSVYVLLSRVVLELEKQNLLYVPCMVTFR